MLNPRQRRLSVLANRLAQRHRIGRGQLERVRRLRLLAVTSHVQSNELCAKRLLGSQQRGGLRLLSVSLPYRRPDTYLVAAVVELKAVKQRLARMKESETTGARGLEHLRANGTPRHAIVARVYQGSSSYTGMYTVQTLDYCWVL